MFIGEWVDSSGMGCWVGENTVYFEFVYTGIGGCKWRVFGD